MRHDHLKRELDLIVLLTQNRSYTTDEICKRNNISRRTLYYYLDFFRMAGFEVEKHGGYYSISRNSYFFKKTFDLVQFTDDEAVMIRNLIDNSVQKTARMKALSQKLERFYDFKIIKNENELTRVTKLMRRIETAIKSHQCLRIIGYSSPNSHTVKDRIVEPFLFMNNNLDVRCFEISSHTNKTFRISRMEDVEILCDEWQFEKQHRKVYTDLFMFSGEKRTTIELLMGQLSHNVMVEEYPLSAPNFAQQEDGKWLFRTEVCSFLGIGRFVLGLYDDIEIISDDDFKNYVKEKIQTWSKQLACPNAQATPQD